MEEKRANANTPNINVIDIEVEEEHEDVLSNSNSDVDIEDIEEGEDVLNMNELLITQTEEIHEDAPNILDMLPVQILQEVLSFTGLEALLTCRTWYDLMITNRSNVSTLNDLRLLLTCEGMTQEGSDIGRIFIECRQIDSRNNAVIFMNLMRVKVADLFNFIWRIKPQILVLEKFWNDDFLTSVLNVIPDWWARRVTSFSPDGSINLSYAMNRFYNVHSLQNRWGDWPSEVAFPLMGSCTSFRLMRHEEADGLLQVLISKSQKCSKGIEEFSSWAKYAFEPFCQFLSEAHFAPKVYINVNICFPRSQLNIWLKSHKAQRHAFDLREYRNKATDWYDYKRKFLFRGSIFYVFGFVENQGTV